LPKYSCLQLNSHRSIHSMHEDLLKEMYELQVLHRRGKETSAMRFSVDDWMIRLYGKNPPKQEYGEYGKRIVSLIWDLSSDLIKRGKDVILNFGFWTRKSRDETRKRIKALGATTKLYHVTCADKTLKERVLTRTDALPDSALYIDEHAIGEFKKRFEALQDDEPHLVVVTD
jgi:predicted kinase